ncbi:hypothetical protein PUN28_019009 [Cardiocondyla obscurior]|uniref:Uncharacterized protein n=1 Tax=Cardiocondyla obscurior TaxID=286306 RepID=A0AAW2EIF0_9HYME
MMSIVYYKCLWVEANTSREFSNLYLTADPSFETPESSSILVPFKTQACPLPKLLAASTINNPAWWESVRSGQHPSSITRKKPIVKRTINFGVLFNWL